VRAALARGLGAAALGLLACASEPARSPVPEPESEPALHQDAVPRVYAEDEVDVPARPLEPILPEYPKSLRELGVEGTVEARVVVWADGSFGGGQVVASSHPEFTDAAREALHRASFAPAQLGGEPVASRVTVVVHFELKR
jgi:TonB family protein